MRFRHGRGVRLIPILVLLAVSAVACGGGSVGITAPTSAAVGGTRAASGVGSTTASISSTTSTPSKNGGPPVASPGCGKSKAGAADGEKHTMQVSGMERYYLLTVPTNHDGKSPLPVVLDFHGLIEGAPTHMKMSNFGALAQKEGFVAAFPNGQGNPLRWDTNSDHQPNTDLAFIDALLAQLGEDLCIDTSRIYSTGLSYGAIMTSFLLCNRAERFAAVAPVAGLQMPTGCAPKRRVPILTFHGTADPILHMDGTVDVAAIFNAAKGGATTSTIPPDLNGPGYPANVAAWAKSNGCDDKATDTKITASVLHRVYKCPTNADVEFDIIIGGGHAWPGSEFSKSIANIVGPTTFEIDATAEAWKFFQRFQLS